MSLYDFILSQGIVIHSDIGFVSENQALNQALPPPPTWSSWHSSRNWQERRKLWLRKQKASSHWTNKHWDPGDAHLAAYMFAHQWLKPVTPWTKAADRFEEAIASLGPGEHTWGGTFVLSTV